MYEIAPVLTGAKGTDDYPDVISQVINIRDKACSWLEASLEEVRQYSRIKKLTVTELSDG